MVKNNAKIKHIWFDVGDTIAKPDQKPHGDLKYGTYAKLKGVKDTPSLRKEFDEAYRKHGSNSNIFVQVFGLGSDFWPKQVDELAETGSYKLMDENAPRVLKELSVIVPVSIFSNINSKRALELAGVDISKLTHILNGSSLEYPKPHPEGYRELIRLSQLPAEEILYIGDLENKDIIPAKSVGLRTGMIWGKSEQADYNFRDFQDILSLLQGGEA